MVNEQHLPVKAGPPEAAPRIENGKSEIVDAYAELHAMLRAEPTLSAQLYETLKSGSWLITMHRKVKDSPPDDLESASTMHGFPIAEVVTVMQSQCRTILADEDRKIHAQEAFAANKSRWK